MNKTFQPNEFNTERHFYLTTIMVTAIAILISVIIISVWFFYFNYSVEFRLDTQSVIGLFAIALGLPVAFAGAWAAIKVANLAFQIQRRQFEFESKQYANSYVNELRISYNRLVNSLNQLITRSDWLVHSSQDIFSVSNANDVGADVDESTFENTFESQIKELHKEFDDLLAVLNDLLINTTFNHFWDWQSKRKQGYQLTKYEDLIKENNFKFKDNLNITDAKQGLISIVSLLKNSRISSMKSYHGFEGLLSYLRIINTERLNWEKSNKSYCANYFDEKPILALSVASAVLARRFISVNDSQEVSLDGFSSILSEIIRLVPSDEDLKLFIIEEIFSDAKNQIGEDNVAKNANLLKFNAEKMLNNELVQVKSLANKARNLDGFFEEFPFNPIRISNKPEFDLPPNHTPVHF